MRTAILWMVLIVLAASTTVSAVVPRVVGYLVVFGVYVVFVAWLVVTDRFAVVYHWVVLSMVLLIWAVFALTTALDPTGAGILRLGAFTVITGINLFVVPAVIDQDIFHDVLAAIAGAFVLIALPTVLLGSYGAIGVTLAPWHTTQRIAGVVLHTPVSIFDNPNYLSAFAAIGAVAAGPRVARSRSPLAAGLLGLNVLGVLLAGGRAALLALVVAGVLYAGYRVGGRAAMATLVGLGTLAIVAGFAMVFGLLPGPSAITHLNIGDRTETWRAAYEAVADRPAIGWGPGDDREILAPYLRDSVDVMTTHNSYIRMFLISGVVGGGAYLVLTASTVVIELRTMRSEAMFTFLLLAVFFVLQLFAGMTIFGLSLLSTLGALFVGYGQPINESRRTEVSVRQRLPDSVRRVMVR